MSEPFDFPPKYEGESYSYLKTHFFESSGGKLVEVLAFVNDDEFCFPPRFDVPVALYEVG